MTVADEPDTKEREFDNRPKVQVVSHGGSYHGHGTLHIDIHGLDSRELELMQGMMNGFQWVRCVNGRIEHVPVYEQLPEPEKDGLMMPFWRPAEPEVETQLKLFNFDMLPEWGSPSITIRALCGYNYSVVNYQFQARKLRRWGFVCLRSERDDSGEYDEHWYLSGLWAAKEEMKEAVGALDAYIIQKSSSEELLRDIFGPRKKKLPKTKSEKCKRELEVAVSFLCRNAQFGCLDVSLQRAAMTID